MRWLYCTICFDVAGINFYSFYSTGMNVNLFLFVWNILIGFELSTASRSLQGGKVKMEKIKFALRDAMLLFFNDCWLARTINP